MCSKEKWLNLYQEMNPFEGIWFYTYWCSGRSLPYRLVFVIFVICIIFVALNTALYIRYSIVRRSTPPFVGNRETLPFYTSYTSVCVTPNQRSEPRIAPGRRPHFPRLHQPGVAL